jgi:hypothetical protein
MAVAIPIGQPTQEILDLNLYSPYLWFWLYCTKQEAWQALNHVDHHEVKEALKARD